MAQQHEATHEPIVLGMVSMDDASKDPRDAAEAAVAYINAELGGVHGRGLRLEVRNTAGTPESSIERARELIALRPVAFVGGVDYFAYAALPLYSASGIPIVGGPSFGDAEMTAPNSYKFMSSGAANWPAMALYATDQLGARTVAVIYPDNVPGTSTVTSFIEPVLGARRATCRRVPFAPDASDLSAAVAEAVGSGPDAIIAIGPAHACRRLLVALKAQRGDVPLFTSTVSIESATVEAVGEEAVVGIYTVSAFNSWGDDPDALVYRDAVRSYVGREELDELGVATFSGVMNLHSLLLDLDPDGLSSEALVAALRSARGRHSFMGHPYTCDGQRFAGRPALCDNHTRVLRVDPGMTRTFVTEWVDPSALIPPPAEPCRTSTTER